MQPKILKNMVLVYSGGLKVTPTHRGDKSCFSASAVKLKQSTDS